MLAELLVLYTCAGGLDGCSESRATYLQQNQELRQVISNVELKAKNILPEYVDSIAPVIAVALDKKVTLPITKHLSIIFKQDTVESKLVYGIDF